MYDRIRLSKTISHALRHAPQQYGLVLDADGWVPVSELLNALGTRRTEWRRLAEDHLVELNETAEKRRFEIRDGKIRARYGHSTAERIDLPPSKPPAILYHGTPVRFLGAIRREGLRPMRRQYVHLSIDEETARKVGRRRHGETALIEVNARAAEQAGVCFYRGNADVWLADPIPPRFLSFPKGATQPSGGPG